MKLRQFLILAVMANALQAGAQLTLDSCRHQARLNYPMIRQYALLDRSRDYTVDNIGKKWLPQLSASAGAAAFSDLLDLPVQAEALTGSIRNAAAGALVSVQQNIYDGGRASAEKNIAKAETEVNRRNVDVSLYGLNSRVEQLFFGILLIDEQLRQNRLLQADLNVNERQVSDMMKGGLANASDVDAVRVETVRCRQSEVALAAVRRAYLRMLGFFIGKKLADSTRLLLPAENAAEATGTDLKRPELQWYDARQSVLTCRRRQLDARLRPTVKAFGAAMAHTNVADMMHNTFFAAGLTLSWNIGALYTRKNDLRRLQTESESIDAERQTFIFNNHLQTDEAEGQIASLQEQIRLDREAVSLREAIYSKSIRKVRSGTETVNEMLRDAIAVSQARQQQSLHAIQLQQALCNRRTISGRQ
jgi:outer membrane protein TolC